MWEDFFPLMLSLGFVIALIFLTAWILKKMNKRSGSLGIYGKKNSMNIVECLPITADKQIIIVKVGGKNLLLGVSPAGINLISELGADDMEIIEQQSLEGANAELSFKSIFDGIKNLKNPKNIHEKGEEVNLFDLKKDE